jgi:Cu/Ag efflux pump CusA
MVGDLQNLIAMALGAEPVTTTVEGRERYNVSIRYPRDYRSDPQAIATEVLIPLAEGGTVPLGQVAKVSLGQGPASIRTENSQLAVYIFVDLRDRDIGGYVSDAQKAVAGQVKFPPGYYVTWSGQLPKFDVTVYIVQHSREMVIRCFRGCRLGSHVTGDLGGVAGREIIGRLPFLPAAYGPRCD